MENINFVRPVPLISPVNGAVVQPRISRFTVGNKIYTEAQWFCPVSGTFMQKGIVSVEDVPTKEDKK